MWDGARCSIVESRDVKFLNEAVQAASGPSRAKENVDQHRRTEEGLANPPTDEGTSISLTFESDEVTKKIKKVRFVSPPPNRSITERLPQAKQKARM